MNISQIFNLGISGHKDISFIDIDERKDTQLYLDPYVIQALPDKFCVEASKCIDTFFLEIFRACCEKKHARLRNLLEYASEPNETNLGMKTISDYGKGATAEKLTKLFLDFYRIVRQNPCIESNPLALCMYIQNFDKDKMSDLITNILRRLLYTFTVDQCLAWGIKLKDTQESIGYYWDYNELNWRELIGRPLSVRNNNILLVPKSIVRPRYVFNVECYIRQYILKILQQEHARNKSDMCIVKEYADGRKVLIPPTIEELYKQEVKGNTHKDYAFSQSSGNKDIEENFIRDIQRRINNGYGAISDDQLDRIVYKKRIIT